MDTSLYAAIFWGAGAVVLVSGAYALKSRLELSRAKYRSLTGHARLARRIAGQIPFYAYEGDLFFRTDNAPEAVVEKRREAFLRLSAQFRKRFAKTLAATEAIREGSSDLRFSERYRVPFQYGPFVRRHLGTGSVMNASTGATVTDLDGNVFYDLSQAVEKGNDVLGSIRL